METRRQVDRPRISREARLLVTTAILAMAALGALARIRYGSAPAAQRPLPTMITSLVASSDFDRMAEKVEAVAARVRPALIATELVRPPHTEEEPPERVSQAVMRLRDDLGVTLVDAGWSLAPDERLAVMARDEASGLAVVRVGGAALPSGLPARAFERPERPRYLMATETLSTGVTLRPLFVGALASVEAPRWAALVWSTPSGLDCRPGAFVFNVDGEWVGLAVRRSRHVALVPANVVIREVDRLVQGSREERGTLGVQGQWVSPPIARATGADHGVAIAWVDPAAPSAEVLKVGDVVEAVNGQRLTSFDQWIRQAAILTAGTAIGLRVWRSRERIDATVIAALVVAAPAAETARHDSSAAPKLPVGLVLQSRPGVGSEVTSVEPASIAGRSSLRVGDVITSFGQATAPTPVQVRRGVSELAPGAAVLIGVRRDGDYQLLVVAR